MGTGKEQKEANGEIEAVERIVGRTLQIGVLLSAAVILAGFVEYIVTGSSGYAGGAFPTTLAAVWQGLLVLKSFAVISAGLLILIFTPVLRVGVSIFVFLKEKDFLYVKITALVFLILIASFLLGKAE
jgi:uncharacterized membrane protein